MKDKGILCKFKEHTQIAETQHNDDMENSSNDYQNRNDEKHNIY